MSQILTKGNNFSRTLRILRSGSCRSNHSDDDKNKDKDAEENPKTVRGGRVVRDKQQSLQEDSFFHKEERQQLKDLKKEIEERNKKSENKD